MVFHLELGLTYMINVEFVCKMRIHFEFSLMTRTIWDIPGINPEFHSGGLFYHNGIRIVLAVRTNLYRTKVIG